MRIEDRTSKLHWGWGVLKHEYLNKRHEIQAMQRYYTVCLRCLQVPKKYYEQVTFEKMQEIYIKRHWARITVFFFCIFLNLLHNQFDMKTSISLKRLFVVFDNSLNIA